MKVRVKPTHVDNFTGFHSYVRRRPGDVFEIEDQPRRMLFPAEKAMVDRDADAAGIYKMLKDKDGKIPSAFSFRWMEPVAPETPVKVTTAQQHVDQKSEEIRQDRAATRLIEEGAGGEAVRSDVI